MKPAPTDRAETSLYAFLTNPSLVDFPGHMAAVFFVSGCDFNCRYCHNPDLLRKRQTGLTWQRLEQVCRGFSENWTTAAVITGGEPTLADDPVRGTDRIW
jgi:pyruvate formate lyase activating enzyme